MARSNPPAPGWRYDTRSHGWYDATEYSSYNEAKTSSRNLGFRNSGLEYGWLSDYKARKLRAQPTPEEPSRPANITDISISDPVDFGRWKVQESASLTMLTRMIVQQHDEDTIYYFIAYGYVVPNYQNRKDFDITKQQWLSLMTAQYNEMTASQLYELCADNAALLFTSTSRWGVVWRQG